MSQFILYFGLCLIIFTQFVSSEDEDVGVVTIVPPGTVPTIPPGSVTPTPPGTITSTPPAPGTITSTPPGTITSTPPTPGTITPTPPGTVPTVAPIVGPVFYCDGTSSNSLCLTPDSSCLDKSFPPTGLNDSTLSDYIVSEHNIRRARVASGGELLGSPGPQQPSRCMAKLYWNTALAKAAQNWVDQCTISGDQVRNKNNSKDPYVGQNVYGYIDPPGSVYDQRNYPQKFYWEQAIQSWYSEVAKFDQATVSNYAYKAAVGHYTQFVWGRTTQIGCGFRRWELDDGSGRFIRLLVCNYWPGGNKVGSPVYSTAKPAYCAAQCFDETFTNPTRSGALCDKLT